MQNHIVEMRKIARQLPQKAGVYLMKDRLGQVIYVGKAKNLRKRVSSYFQGSKKFVWAQTRPPPPPGPWGVRIGPIGPKN